MSRRQCWFSDGRRKHMKEISLIPEVKCQSVERKVARYLAVNNSKRLRPSLSEIACTNRQGTMTYIITTSRETLYFLSLTFVFGQCFPQQVKGPYTRHSSLLVGRKTKALRTDGRTDQRTSQRTDGHTLI